MAGKEKEAAAPEADDVISVNPGSFDAEGDYRWDRKYLVGAQRGTLVRCKSDRWPSGDACISISVGFKSPDGGGVMIDHRLNPIGPEWRLFIAAFAPEFLNGGNLRLRDILGRVASVTIVEEWVESKQQNYPRLTEFAPISGGQAQAPAKAPGADL